MSDHHPDHFQGDGCGWAPVEDDFDSFEEFLDRVERELAMISPNEHRLAMARILRKAEWIELAEKAEAQMDTSAQPPAPGSDDQWVEVPEPGMIRVLMTAAQANAYQWFLASQNCHLFEILDLHEGDPQYAIGVRWMPGDPQ